MTPEEAYKLYWDSYLKLRIEASDQRKPINQVELSISAFQPLIDQIEKDFVNSQAIKYLENSNEEG